MFTWLRILGEWLYANTVGNLVASLIAVGAAGAWTHIKVIRPLHRRLDHQDRKLQAIHEQTGGET